MKHSLRDIARVELAPPAYLKSPVAGIDVSASGVKMVLLKETLRGIQISSVEEELIPSGTIQESEIVNRDALAQALISLARKHHVLEANITLSESRGYLFETQVEGSDHQSWCTQVEQHLDEHIPLPGAEVVFDIVPLSGSGEHTQVIGVGYPRKVVENSVAVFEQAHMRVRAIEAETFALPRALLKPGHTETVLIVDIGRTSTKLLIASDRLPRMSTTLAHTFTGTEVAPTQLDQAQELANEIRDEIIRRIEYWNSRKEMVSGFAPVSQVLLVGGRANITGLPEFLGTVLGIPVVFGDVFANLAEGEQTRANVSVSSSLAYGTAIGLALREHGHAL